MYKNDKPLIELRIDPENDSFVSGIALCEFPAIQSDFLFFSNTDIPKAKALEFAANDDMMELLGLAMVPNEPIDRQKEDGTEYDVVFSASTVRYISQVFAQKGLFNSTNIEHSTIPADSFIFQSYITDNDRGVYAPKGIKNSESVPNGSWVIGVKVLNPKIWNDIKTGVLKGFSAEGMFQCFEIKQLAQLSRQPIISELEQALIELDELEKLFKNIIETI